MTHTTEIEFRLHQGWGDFQNLWCMKYEHGKAYNGYLKDGIVEWQEVKDGVGNTGLIPFMKVDRRFPLQEMIDALTNTKKATEQIETLSELKATRYHLEDMRKLAFGLLPDKENGEVV